MIANTSCVAMARGTISEENPHREHFETHQLSYWTLEGVAAGRDRGEIVNVEQFVPGFGTMRIARHYWPAERYAVEILTTALGRAFDAGKAAKADEIRKALGIAK